MASKGSQTPSQTLNCLVSAFYGWQKIFKKLLENLKNLRIPLSGPRKQGTTSSKHSRTKTKPEPEEGSRTIQEEPLLTEGLSVHIGNIYREQKRRGTPPLNTSAEKHPSHLYVSRRLNQLCIRSALQHPGSSCRGEPSQNDRAADHP